MELCSVSVRVGLEDQYDWNADGVEADEVAGSGVDPGEGIVRNSLMWDDFGIEPREFAGDVEGMGGGSGRGDHGGGSHLRVPHVLRGVVILPGERPPRVVCRPL